MNIKKNVIHGLLPGFQFKCLSAKDLGDKFGESDYGLFLNDIWGLLLILLGVTLLCLLIAASLFPGDECLNI